MEHAGLLLGQQGSITYRLGSQVGHLVGDDPRLAAHGILPDINGLIQPGEDLLTLKDDVEGLAFRQTIPKDRKEFIGSGHSIDIPDGKLRHLGQIPILHPLRHLRWGDMDDGIHIGIEGR